MSVQKKGRSQAVASGAGSGAGSWRPGRRHAGEAAHLRRLLVGARQRALQKVDHGFFQQHVQQLRSVPVGGRGEEGGQSGVQRRRDARGRRGQAPPLGQSGQHPAVLCGLPASAGQAGWGLAPQGPGTELSATGGRGEGSFCCLACTRSLRLGGPVVGGGSGVERSSAAASHQWAARIHAGRRAGGKAGRVHLRLSQCLSSNSLLQAP
jgi:hypothetical protein